MSVDLSIHNYNFSELIDLFKLEHQFINTNENTQRMKNMLISIKEQFSNDIYIFYLKAYIIITTIYQLLKKDIDESEISFYMKKIKKIKAFEKYDCGSIIEIIYSEPKIISKNGSDSIILPNPNTNTIVDNFPNSIAPGNLNSIKRITQFQNINLNTCFRTNYFNSSSCNFQYSMPNEIKNIVSMRLASIEIPNAWYLFSHSKHNNIFKIEIIVDNTITHYSIIIPDGNYDSESLQNYLNSTYFCDSALETHLQYIRFSIDNHTFKSQFEIIEDKYESCNECNPSNFKFTLLFSEDSNSNCMNRFGWILGFRYPQYSNIDKRITSEALFDGAGDRYIYMSLTDYQYNNNGTNIIGFDKSSMDEDILAKIPMTNGKLSLVINEGNPLTKTRRYNGPVNINKLQIKILDKFGEIIDLNNMDFSFTLEVEILYESFNFRNVNG